MGSLSRFNLAALRKIHGLKSLVETGTATGDSVEYARQAGFESIHTIEIVPALAETARARFSDDKRVHVYTGDSRERLPEVLADLPPGPALFWLDAHFPGAHTGADYAAEPDLNRRLPLRDEVELIGKVRRGMGDVILIDDARMYQPGPYSGGDLPADWGPLKGLVRSLDFVREQFSKTHGVVVDYADQGYVMVCPRLVEA